jgi:excisionase family DNA binding protein
MSNPFDVIEAKLTKIESILSDLLRNPEGSPPPAEPEEIFLTVKEAANFLKLSVPTVYTLMSKKHLPFLKRSQKCYFLKSELIDYLKAGRRKTNNELKADVDKYLTR